MISNRCARTAINYKSEGDLQYYSRMPGIKKVVAGDWVTTNASATDDALVLESLGYKSELKREFSKWQIFGVSFSIMCLAPSIASVLGQGMISGGAGMTWGWFVVCFFIMSVGIALSEFSSAMPTSGGVYYWTFHFAPKKSKNCLCFLGGYVNTLGQIAGAGSVNYGLATQLLSCPAMMLDYTPTKYETYGVFCAALISEVLLGMLPLRFIARIQSTVIVLNVATVIILIIALPVGLLSKGGSLNSASFVFGDTTNLTGYPYGWSYLLSWMPALWTISSHDACIHMAEEAANSPVAVPFGIILAVGLCWGFGWVLMCVIAAVIKPDFSALDTPSGNVMAQVIEDALNKHWAVALMSLFTAMNWTMCLSGTVAAARETWAFARDGALPFSRFWYQTWWDQPIPAMIFNSSLAALLGLLILVNDTAANAIFSLGITASYLSWGMPALLRAIFFDPNSFRPGPFYMGHTLHRINCIIAAIFSIFVVFALSIIPTSLPVDKNSMNYTVAMSGGVCILCLLYYFVSARKWFKGPVTTVNDTDILEGLPSAKSGTNNDSAAAKEGKLMHQAEIGSFEESDQTP